MSQEWEAQRAQDEQEMQARINRFVNNLPIDYGTPRRVYHAAREAAQHYEYTGAALEQFAETAEARYRARLARAQSNAHIETTPTATLLRIARKLARQWQRATPKQQGDWQALALIAEEVERRQDSPLPLFYARLLAAREAQALGREYAAAQIPLNHEQARAMGHMLAEQRIRAGYHTALDAVSYCAFFAEQFRRGYQRSRRLM